MIRLCHTCCSSVLWRTGYFVTKSQSFGYVYPSWKASFRYSGVRTAKLGLLVTRFQAQCYSSKKSGRSSSSKQKKDPKLLMKDDKEAFVVVRKGDLVGVYKSLSDCEDQDGTLVSDHPVSVYKASMPKDIEKCLTSCGLKNALYSISASDLTEELFGTLVACPLQPSSEDESPTKPAKKKRSKKALQSDYGQSCTLEFDGASKGNPGQAGAGAILRSDDGSLICRLRQGLGIATCNAAEYHGFILGLKYALQKGFTNIRVRGDSKLICMQIQGLWRVKSKNISTLYKQAEKLKGRFISFEIMHVLRHLNSEADAQANLAVKLAEGQIQEAIDK